MRTRLAALFCFATCLSGAPAADQSDILRYVPRQAEFVVVVDHPRQLVNAIGGFEPIRQLAAFEAVKEQLDSTNSRRFRQLVAHFEKTLNRQWPELIDDLAGGGAALAMRFDSDPPAAMLVLKAKNEATLRRAFDMFIEVVKSELERTESPEKIEAHTYRGCTGYKLGPDAFAAVAGPVLFFSNKSEAVKLGIDLYINGAGESLAKSGKTDAARALLPPNPLQWTYIDLERAHNSSEGKEAYAYPKGDPGQLLFLQGMLDVIGKSPFVVTGTYQTADGFRTTIRMPAGRTATPPGLSLHLPPDGKPGSLPLLEPKNLLFSTSFYFDIGKLWTEREKLLSQELRKALEDADKNLGRFLAGKKLADLLTSVGPYHRLVVVARDSSGYKIQPDNLQPAGAIVSDLKNSAYADAMNGVLRAVALFAGGKYKLKMTEEKIGEVTLVSYRFPEKGKVPDDEGNGRFNISPCFARVGNQFMVASTVELGRELVELLSRAETNDPTAGSPKTSRMLIDAAGGAEVLKVFEDRVLTQTILNQAIPAEQASKETKAFIAWLRGLGQLNFEIDYGANDFRYEVTLRRRENKN